MITILLVLFLVTLTYWAYRSYKPPKKFPTGPPRFPFIGSLLGLDPDFPSAAFYRWQKKYGDFYGLKLGMRDYVVICDPIIMKHAFTSPDFSSRPFTFTFQHCSRYINSGIINASGRVWQDNRRFSLRHLRDLGLGKSSIEDIVKQEIKEHIQHISSKEGQSIEISWDLNTAITNIIWWIVAGRRFPLDSPKIWKLQELTQKVFMQFGKTAVIDFYPWLLQYFPKKILGVDVLEKYNNELMDFYQEEIDEHKSSFEADEEDRNLIDMYLRKMKEEENEDGYDEEFENFNLRILVAQFFVAGGETTFTTLRWAFLYLIKFPDIQKKIQKELDSVVGGKRMPTLDDKPKLVYLEAFINEVHRSASIASIGVFHATDKDVTFMDYSIPKGTIIVPFIYGSHNNPKYWKNPEEFNPDRFLDGKGNLIKQDALMPFCVGRRQCLGEALARTELFLFISCLCQHFNFEAVGGPDKVDLSPLNEALARYPKIHNLVATKRKLA